MGKLPKQTKRNDLIKRFKELRFTGPYTGIGDHPQFMQRKKRVVKIPNPHRGDIGEGLLKKIIAEAGLTVEQWLGQKPLDDEDETEEGVAELSGRAPVSIQHRGGSGRR